MPDICVQTINEAVRNERDAFVLRSEKEYKERLSALAGKVVGERVRAVLLAGPSAAGKTTTANLLADAIRSLGHRAEVVSLDNFYRDSTDPAYPRFENGERNMECAEALRLDKIRECLGKIENDEGFTVPVYDFKYARAVGEETYSPLHDGCVILEGLHALNPLITADLPADAHVLRLFVSLSTNLVDTNGDRLMSGRKMRFVRRLVRDHLYRAASGERTLSLWKHVLDGEQLYLYPYKALADVAFDTFHGFEPSVLRPFAEDLLEEIRDDEYAAVILSAIRKVAPMDIAAVPDDSLIREFIPGGIYEDKY